MAAPRTVPPFLSNPKIGEGKPYRELTAACLPSFFTRTHPFALVHLHQPTCVGFRYGSVRGSALRRPRRFSGKRALRDFPRIPPRISRRFRFRELPPLAAFPASRSWATDENP